jgi:hypothetical protein
MITKLKRVRVLLGEPKSPIAEDRLTGAGEIAAFWFGNDSPDNRKKVFRLIAARRIPAGKIGNLIVASKARLLEYHKQTTYGQAAE